MELINNTTKTLKEDLSVEIKKGSKLSIAAACFSIYAFQELKNQLSNIDELRFIFTSPTFVTEKAKKEKREFYIPRLNRERSLYGTEFEIKLRNELTQKAIAKECAEWIRKKVTFKSNISDKTIQGGIVVDDVGYTPINNFTTVELGCEKGNVISTTIVKDSYLAKTLLADFDEIWNNNKVLQKVTDEVIYNITAAYNENSPDFIYFVTLYNIFNEFLEDVSEDVLPNEATGFKDSKIWSMLYNFQKDAALAIINKLEKYNGCILADSVGLGKTFTALAVIKYYENRNKSVLVLCPKKLTNNWNTYKDNYHEKEFSICNLTCTTIWLQPGICRNCHKKSSPCFLVGRYEKSGVAGFAIWRTYSICRSQYLFRRHHLARGCQARKSKLSDCLSEYLGSSPADIQHDSETR